MSANSIFKNSTLPSFVWRTAKNTFTSAKIGDSITVVSSGYYLADCRIESITIDTHKINVSGHTYDNKPFSFFISTNSARTYCGGMLKWNDEQTKVTTIFRNDTIIDF